WRGGRDHGLVAAKSDHQGGPAAQTEPMTHSYQEPGRFTSGLLAVAVHVLFITMLVFGIRWQQRLAETSVAELWEEIPPPKAQRIARPPEPAPPPPTPKPQGPP